MELSSRFNKNVNVLYVAQFFSSFSYYGLLALLLFFSINTLKMSQIDSYRLLGNFVGVSMIAALISGFVGSQYLSARFCCLLGYVGYVVGCFLLARYHDISSIHEGLAFIAGGFGLFEPNAKILFGSGFHAATDSNRNIGFIIFYLFNIIGQFFGPIVLTYLKIIDPHYIFVTAGICSLVGLIFIAVNFTKMGVIEFSRERIEQNKDSFFRSCVAAFLLSLMVYIIFQGTASGFIDSLTAMVFIPWVVLFFLFFRRMLGFDEDVEMSEKFEKRKNLIIGTLAVGVLFFLSFYFSFISRNLWLGKLLAPISRSKHGGKAKTYAM